MTVTTSESPSQTRTWVPAVMAEALRVQRRKRGEDVDAEVGGVVEPLGAEVVGVQSTENDSHS